MSGNFFDKLELELAGLARKGTHLDATAGDDRRRVTAVFRHSAMIVILAVVLAASLASEFPAAASGHALVARVAVIRAL